MTGPLPALAAVVDLARLPAVPHVLLKLIECCQQENVSFDQLAGIVRQDPALTARVITVAQSSALAQWNHLNDLNRILVVLGVDVIRTIAITSAVGQYFHQLSPGASKQRGILWCEAIACAHASQALARLTSYSRPEEAYLTGLLHNLGRLVYLHQHPDAYASLMTEALGEEALSEAERSRFGAPSPELGAMLVRDWAPDSFLSDALRFQREPAGQLTGTPALVRLVNLASKLQTGLEPDRLYAEADQLFGLNMASVQALHGQVKSQVSATVSQYGITLEPEGQAQLEDEATRGRLARQVESFALAHGLTQRTPPGGSAAEPLWSQLLHNLALLFGLKDSLALAYDADGPALRGVAAGHLASPTLSEFAIRLPDSPSLLARALHARKILSQDKADNPLPVIDQQLQRRLGEGRLTAIPLLGPRAPLGVIAVALPDCASTPPMLMIEQFRRSAVQALQQQAETQESLQHQLGRARQQWQDHQHRLVHEAGNPLGVIQNYLHLLSQKLQDEREITGQLQVIREEIDRVGTILLRMKAPPQAAAGDDSADINALVEDLVCLYRESVFATHGIGCRLQLDPELASVRSDANALKQVLTNLLKNAAEALPAGGHIHLETRQLNVGGNPFVEIRIYDDGPGIAPAMLPRLFTPVTSTKGESHSGLGLTIVANLVHQLDGTISCTNRDEGGAEFVVRLPRLSTQQPAEG